MTSILNKVSGIIIGISLLALFMSMVYLLIIGLVMHRNLVNKTEAMFFTSFILTLLFGLLLKIAANYREVINFLKWLMS